MLSRPLATWVGLRAMLEPAANNQQDRRLRPGSRMPDWTERGRDGRAFQDASVGASHHDKTKNKPDSSR